MNEFWDKRYSEEVYAYGTEPNAFFKEELDKLEPGTLLLPGEGEGRNAIYAAINGWEVTAFDQSIAAKQKAEKLAKKHQVKIKYEVCGIDQFEADEDYYDCIGLIFLHVPPNLRTDYHQKLLRFLKPGGTILLEGFEKSQINNQTGGPKKEEMLFSKEKLYKDFKSIGVLVVSEVEINLDEGTFHNGISNLIRLTGNKR